jgi:hypothetical protein
MSRGEDEVFRVVDGWRFLEVRLQLNGRVTIRCSFGVPQELWPEEAREMAYFLNKFADEAVKNRPDPKRPGDLCPKCGIKTTKRDGLFAWRGMGFSLVYCQSCNAAWNNEDDSFLDHVKKTAVEDQLK